MKVRYRARAISNLEEVYLYLEPRSVTGARNVLRSIYVAVQEIAQYPYGAEQTSDPDIRVKVLGRYRYKIFIAWSSETSSRLFIFVTRLGGLGRGDQGP